MVLDAWIIEELLREEKERMLEEELNRPRIYAELPVEEDYYDEEPTGDIDFDITEEFEIKM